MPDPIQSGTRTWRSRVVALTALGLAASLSLVGCGADTPGGNVVDDEWATSPAARTPGDPVPNTSSDALTVDNLADQCDRLAPIVGSLRGSFPDEVTASAATDAEINGFGYRTAHCTYSYPGDSFSDPNRVDIYLDSASEAAAMLAHWRTLASTEPVPGIGDDATWYSNTSADARSSARALVGSEVISVRVSVPKEMGEEQFLTKEALSVALGAVVAQL
ncbi:hypothetical protein [Nocardioides sp. AE5]|uniref:hypothetical protein n=1 Tax=Nocardioides sp. AE5 TaxID=2962573 RepID=UPI00288234E4|nr:hypothetical protein [Nocardioides sp. AE5]MDT0202748.1 hypothetical protein [Nocardioides sp. AE5]